MFFDNICFRFVPERLGMLTGKHPKLSARSELARRKKMSELNPTNEIRKLNITDLERIALRFVTDYRSLVNTGYEDEE